MDTSNKPCFTIHPSVIYQLGESLISDVVQALIELIKNSYDADANYAKIVIDTKGAYNSEDHRYLCDTGSIVIEDDGFGMTREDIENGWLTISNRQKRDFKVKKQLTEKGRTPLGDKGLGRLGVQRLGENIEIFTKAINDKGYRFAFSWLDFATAPTLKDVEIVFDEYDFPKKKGTKIVISGLREPETWNDSGAIKKLEQGISQMISPFKKIRNFIVNLEIDGVTLELSEINENLREVAPLKYEFKFDGSVFFANGAAKFSYLRPKDSKEKDDFALLVESDNGKAFFEFLCQQNKTRAFNLEKVDSDAVYLKFSWFKKFTDFDKFSKLPNGEIANPGPFFGEIDFFSLSPESERPEIFSKLNEFKTAVKKSSGIKVYRDGFRIRTDDDWLMLGKHSTSAGSYYALRPENTIGFVGLSARYNLELEETTDREGFKDSPYYRNFFGLLQDFVSETSELQEFLRRSYWDFKKEVNFAKVKTDPRENVEEISRSLKKKIADLKNNEIALKEVKNKAQGCIAKGNNLALRMQTAKEVTPDLKNEVSEFLKEINLVFEKLNKKIDEASESIRKTEYIENNWMVLNDTVEALKYQMEQAYESIALGLTAEALSHEIHNVADQLANRSKSLKNSLANKEIKDPALTLFIEYVHSAVRALRKQLSFLAPSLRYVREERHEIDVYKFADEVRELYETKSRVNNIAIQILDSGKKPFKLRINKGRLNQIIDNLLLNSDYWLKEVISKGEQSSGNIFIEISCPFVRIYDDGRGIDPHYELTLFEPFVSGKRKDPSLNQGRGLGLFITKQLLDSCGGNIGLLPERNGHGRLFKFQIDFRGCLLNG